MIYFIKNQRYLKHIKLFAFKVIQKNLNYHLFKMFLKINKILSKRSKLKTKRKEKIKRKIKDLLKK